MVAPIVKRCPDVNHFVARQNATFHRFLDSGFDRLDVFAGHDSTDDRIDELEARSRLERVQSHLRVSVLAAPTGLSNILTHPFGSLSDRLAVSHLRADDIGIDPGLALLP